MRYSCNIRYHSIVDVIQKDVSLSFTVQEIIDHIIL